jgi:hypothetical protein
MSVRFWQVQSLEGPGTRGDAEDGPPSPFGHHLGRHPAGILRLVQFEFGQCSP